MPIRALIVDDEPLARLNLSTLLAEEPDFTLVGECGDGASAGGAVETLHPDVVFLDVQMPGIGGLVFAAALGGEAAPAIVFVTAHERYALPAFDIQALDYLLKPFRRERFAEALQRVRRHAASRARAMSPSDRFAVKCGDRVVLVDYDELCYVRAAGNYVQLHAADRVLEVREAIGALQRRLPADRFLRIHRSYLVNLAVVREMVPAGGGEFVIVLRGGKELPVGPTYPGAIRGALGAGGL